MDLISWAPASIPASIPGARFDALLDLAEQSGRPVDIHLDEHLEQNKMLCGAVADAVIARGLHGRVTLGILCGLSTLEATAAYTLRFERIARAGITVVALPQTNLFLQDRAAGTPLRRGMSAGA